MPDRSAGNRSRSKAALHWLETGTGPFYRSQFRGEVSQESQQRVYGHRGVTQVSQICEYWPTVRRLARRGPDNRSRRLWAEESI